MGVNMENIVESICVFLLNNINDEVTVEMLENEFHYNRFYLIRLFKSYTGYTIKEFINYVKVLKTINPLIFTDDTILKIALNNGFNSQEYYSEKFREIIGISPLKFRKNYGDLNSISDLNELKARREYLAYLYQCENQIMNLANYSQELEKIRKIS